MIFERNILLTGGAGFIGCHAVKHFVNTYPNYRIVVLDKLTYAGNLENLKEVSDKPNYTFVEGDICDAELVKNLFAEYQIDGVMHLAAESHVDRSIENPMEFVMTNIVGTVTLLNAAVKAWGEYPNGRVVPAAAVAEPVEAPEAPVAEPVEASEAPEAPVAAVAEPVEAVEARKYLFYHISTDEVYGSLGAEGLFREDTPYDPRSPYSASKASSDHFVRAYHETYGLPVVISNCSNNYGPNQYPEKLIPVVIRQIINQKPIPVYGKGENIRDWLFVGDHVSAMDAIWHKGVSGETYNVGGNNEWMNIELVKKLCGILDQKLKRVAGTSEKLISYVTDRKGHDLRYAIDAGKLKKELNWEPQQKFDAYLSTTVDYYLKLFNN